MNNGLSERSKADKAPKQFWNFAAPNSKPPLFTQFQITCVVLNRKPLSFEFRKERQKVTVCYQQIFEQPFIFTLKISMQKINDQKKFALLTERQKNSLSR